MGYAAGMGKLGWLVVLCLGGAVWPQLALAGPRRPTPLLEVDLKTGTGRSFDQSKGRTKADDELDAMLDKATGPTFSSKELKKISAALRRYLRLRRPRAQPKLLLFLYPGRISKVALQELRQVKVDVELVVDPCQRTVCKASVALHLELLGKSIRQVDLRTDSYAISFSSVTIRARQDLRDAPYETYRFTAQDVVLAGKKSGAGLRLLNRLATKKAGYQKEMTRSITRRLRARRVRLAGAPRLDRSGKELTVTLRIRSDRVRVKAHVVGALKAAAEALTASPLTPPRTELVVHAAVRMRGKKERIFGCSIQPLRLHLGGRVGQSELWSTYVVERKKQGRHLSFDDAEASGRARPPRTTSPAQITDLLAGHTELLAPCLQAEARRRRTFSGVTLHFSVSASGRAQRLTTKPAGSSTLRYCLQRALGKIRFPWGGTARSVQYPIYIKR